MPEVDYVCAECGRALVSPRSDEEAEQEMHETFGGSVSLADCDPICDDCYQAIMLAARS